MARTVLILGAGTGGLVAAHRLRRMLDKEHQVILVDRSPQYSFAPSYTWVMLGMRDARRISRDVSSVQKKGIEFLLGEVQAIDAAGKRITVNEREYFGPSAGGQGKSSGRQKSLHISVFFKPACLRNRSAEFIPQRSALPTLLRNKFRAPEKTKMRTDFRTGAVDGANGLLQYLAPVIAHAGSLKCSTN